MELNRLGKNCIIQIVFIPFIVLFRCATGNCAAAFTTKQCLQFHYKKVHNFTEENMPKIERSIDYTFQAYSGYDEIDNKNENSNNQTKTNAQLDEESDIDDDSKFKIELIIFNCLNKFILGLDSKSIDDPPALQSPLQVTDEQSQPSSSRSPLTAPDSYISPPNNMKVLTKGSKKWIGDDHIKTTDTIYQIDHRLTSKDDINIPLQVPENEIYERSNKMSGLNDFGRHHQEASNASLLVEAALDSVCSEPNIDMDVSSQQNCTDTLVNNLYSLAQQQQNDNLQNAEVTYSETVCISEQQRDMNLISPSVNDHISVTDELNDELHHHNHNINIDYTHFHQDADFSPTNSPGIMQQRSNFVRNYINSLSPPPQAPQTYNKNLSPVPSPPRYDFGHNNNVNNNEHLSSDDSNGMAAQNLSLNNNSKNDIQLDLSIYKSPYKELHIKNEQKQILTINNLTKNYINCETNSSSLETEVDNMNQHDLSNNLQQNIDDVKQCDESERVKYNNNTNETNENDGRNNKFEIDLDLRLKNYDIDDSSLRNRNHIYETINTTNDVDFRNKNYEIIDNSIESRTTNLDTEFRTTVERNFEPLILNSSEIQGLDMSARSFHNYSNINRFHHLYPDVDRVDLRLNYSPPPPPTYTHADILRVVSLDLTPPGRHSVDLSLRSHPLHPIANTRLLTEHGIHHQSRLLSSDSRLLSETSGRILSDHTTTRILANDQLTTNHLLTTAEQGRLLSDESRLLSEQSRLISDGRILPPPQTTPNGSVSPVPTFGGYSVAQSPYHPTPLAPRSHVTSPTPTYHHYSTYY